MTMVLSEFSPPQPSEAGMSAKLCVCGCNEDEHHAIHEESHYPESRTVETWQACEKHGCSNFRPVLDWPDAEGWWWCAGDDFAARLVLAGQDFHNQRYVSMHGGAHTKTQFEAYFGVTARFTRLLEPNPFPSTTK